MKWAVGHFVCFALVAAVVVLLASCNSLKTAPPDADASTEGGTADDAGESGFTIVHEVLDGGALRALSVVGSEQVYTAGEDGVLLELLADGGWQKYRLGSGVNVNGIWSAGPDEALAVATLDNTNKGPIFRRAMGEWTQIGTAPHGLRAVWGIDDVRYVGGNDGVIYSGPPDDPLGEGIQQALLPNVPETLFAPIVYSISGNSKTAVMAALDFDTTMFFEGAGTLWHTYQDPIDRTRSFRAMWGFPGRKVEIWQGANYYGLWQFTGPGKPVFQANEEKDQPQNANRWIWGIWGPSRDKIVCVGDAGRIMTYDKASGRVTIQPSPTGKNLFAIGGTSLDDIWIVGEDQLILHGHLAF